MTSTTCNRSSLELEFKWLVPVEENLFSRRRAILACAHSTGAARAVKNVDYYFDTPSRKIEKSRAAMRMRAARGKFELTVKSATKLKNGLASRTETTLPLAARSAAEAIELAARANPFGIRADSLGIVFRISNRRTDYSLRFKTCSAVLSFDDVTIYAGQKAVRMKEIELEYQAGRKADFTAFIRCISKASGLQPCLKSKVATARAAAAL